MAKQKITPFLWFNDQAEEAVNYYCSLFKDSKILNIARYSKGTPGEPGKVMTISFELFGQHFTALNGGPQFPFTEAVSFVVNCESQEEIDKYWNELSKDGMEVQCGWLKDKYGLSWQIVPSDLGKLISGTDAEGSARVMQALMKMKKLEMATLQEAYDHK